MQVEVSKEVSVDQSRREASRLTLGECVCTLLVLQETRHDG